MNDNKRKPEIKFCMKCGAPVGEKDTFCMICGYKIERDFLNQNKEETKDVSKKEEKKELSLTDKVKQQKEKVILGTKKVVEDVKKEKNRIVSETKKTIDETKKKINEEKEQEEKKEEIKEAKIETKEEVKEEKKQTKDSKIKKQEKEAEDTKTTILICFGLAAFLSILSTLTSGGIIGVCISVLTTAAIYIYSFCIENEIIKNSGNFKKSILTLCYSIMVFVSILCMFIVFISSINKKSNNTNNNYPQQEEKKEQKKPEEKKEEPEREKEEEKKEEDPTEPEESNTQEESDNKIIMEDRSTDFTGKNYKDVEQEMKNLGFTNVTSNGKETTNEKAVNENVFEITINNKSFYEGDKFLPTDEVKINYWIVKEEESVEYVPPKKGSKIEQDYDSETSNDETKYYFNVDGVKNVPKVQKYENAYITDGVYEYITYLKSLGYKVEITKVNNREPYKGYHLYETYFKVSKGTTSWTMYLGIDDEDYVEYGLEIYLK